MGRCYKTSEATRQTICGALKGLMARKPLEKITISEIMAACGMRRQHFYYYFTDIYDLVRWMFEAEALELLGRQEDEPVWQEGLLRLFRYIDENRAVCLCALDSLGRSYLKRLFETDVNGLVCYALERVIRQYGFPASPEKEDVTVRFLTIAIAGIMESWLRGDLRQTPEELIAMFDMMFQDYLRGAALRLGRQENVSIQRKQEDSTWETE